MDRTLPPGAPSLSSEPLTTGPLTTGPLTIAQSARRVGAWVWAERALYEVVGGWVASTTSPAAKIYFDACSQHHAWRERLWLERLPARLVQAYPGDGLPQAPSDLVSPPWAGAEAAMEALSRLGTDAGRLAAYCRVTLARSAVAYRAWQKRCSVSSDKPVARVLSLVLADVVADWQDGAGVLVELLAGPAGEEAIADAAGATSEIERCLLARGLMGDA